VSAAERPQDPPAAPDAVGRGQRRGRRVLGVLASRWAGWTAAGLLAGAVTGLSVALAGAPSGLPTTPPVAPGGPGVARPGFGPRAARHAPGALGRVDAVSSSGFTMTTRRGETLTVLERPSTVFRSATGAASASAVAAGELVYVLGARSGATITARLVTILPVTGGATY